MDDPEELLESKAGIGSMMRFASDWVGGDSRQSASYRQVANETVIDMSTSNDDLPKRVDERHREWSKVKDLDAFLSQVYSYYLDNGFWGVLTRRVSTLVMVGFLVYFSIFLVFGMDWKFVSDRTDGAHYSLLDVVIMRSLFSMPWIIVLSMVIFTIGWLHQWFRIIQDLPNLYKMRSFYNKCLRVPDEEVQSEDFGEIVEKMCQLQREHPISKDRLDARDICNRLMRKENFLIAMFNKRIFDVQRPFPVRPSDVLTKTLEWNLNFCVINFLFDEKGNIRRDVIKGLKREHIARELKRRFVLLGIANLILSPFILIMLIAYLLFKYGEELYRNPRTIAKRQYTNAARWKLREFNELSYLLERRLAHSHSKANKYMDQFNQSQWIPLAKLIAFISGSIAVVMLGMTIANENLLMHFEITQGKSVIWYLGMLGVILAISRAMIPDTHKAHDPKKLMEAICGYIHYCPSHWKGKLHTQRVYQEFTQIYDYKFLIWFHEIISVIITPLILMFALPNCVDDLIGFIREFTIHVDGLGYICSFALFDFEKGGRPMVSGMTAGQNHGESKLETSLINFIGNHPKWKPEATETLRSDSIGDIEINATNNAPRKQSDQGMGKREVQYRDPDDGLGFISILKNYGRFHM